jgi:hypothetical protein
VFAASILLFLPLAVSKRDWLLSGALVICLWWCHSAGAWLGLAAALLVMRRSTGAAGYWTGVFLTACGLIAVWGKFHSPEAANRWGWWLAAGRMILARPLAGFGPGSFGWVAPGFQRESWGIATIFAHSHFLEVAAECGIPFLLLWLAGLGGSLRRGGAHKRFGAAAVLVQSFWDFGLSFPGVFWLFCYFAASSASEESRGVNVPARAKAPLCAAVAAAALLAAGWSWRLWRADILKAQAAELLSAGDPGERSGELLARSLSLAPDPEAERLAAETELRRARGSREGLLRAGGHFRRAAALDPYRPSNWNALARISQQLGDEVSARRFLEDGARYCPVLRTNFGNAR